jgi:hypothetical protein
VGACAATSRAHSLGIARSSGFQAKETASKLGVTAMGAHVQPLRGRRFGVLNAPVSEPHPGRVLVENPHFEISEGRATSRVRVCRNGFDSVIELELLEGQTEWRVLGDTLDAEQRVSVAAFVAKEYAKDGHGAKTHRRLTSERPRE